MQKQLKCGSRVEKSRGEMSVPGGFIPIYRYFSLKILPYRKLFVTLQLFQ